MPAKAPAKKREVVVDPETILSRGHPQRTHQQHYDFLIGTKMTIKGIKKYLVSQIHNPNLADFQTTVGLSVPTSGGNLARRLAVEIWQQRRISRGRGRYHWKIDPYKE